MKDETGLDGPYNFDLMWNETEGPSVFSAIQKIGLRLEPRKVPVSYFVIESAARPSGRRPPRPGPGRMPGGSIRHRLSSLRIRALKDPMNVSI